MGKNPLYSKNSNDYPVEIVEFLHNSIIGFEKFLIEKITTQFLFMMSTFAVRKGPNNSLLRGKPAVVPHSKLKELSEFLDFGKQYQSVLH